MLDQPVKTPCIGVCSTGIGDSVCRGCKRFSHEVIHWNSYTRAQKQIIDDRLSGFLAQCVGNVLQVIDPALLRWQLDVQKIRYVETHDPHCWVFCLLKAGAQQIDDPAEFGFSVDIRYRDQTLLELREFIDQQFFSLSEAHYQRYMQTPDMFDAQDAETR